MQELEIEEPKIVIVYNTNDELEIKELEKEKEYIIQSIKYFGHNKLKFLDFSLDDGEICPALIYYTNGKGSYTFKINACYDFLKEAEEAQDGVKNFITSCDKKKKKSLYYKTKKKLLNFVDNIYDIFYDIEWKKLDTENTIQDLCKIQIKIPIQEIEDIVREFVDISKLNELMEGSLRVFMEENLFFNRNSDKYFITTNNTPSSCSKEKEFTKIKKEEKEFTNHTLDEIKKEEKEFTNHTLDEFDFNPELDHVLFNKLVETSDPIHVSDGKFQNDLHAYK